MCQKLISEICHQQITIDIVLLVKKTWSCLIMSTVISLQTDTTTASSVSAKQHILATQPSLTHLAGSDTRYKNNKLNNANIC